MADFIFHLMSEKNPPVFPQSTGEVSSSSHGPHDDRRSDGKWSPLLESGEVDGANKSARHTNNSTPIRSSAQHPVGIVMPYSCSTLEAPRHSEPLPTNSRSTRNNCMVAEEQTHHHRSRAQGTPPPHWTSSSFIRKSSPVTEVVESHGANVPLLVAPMSRSPVSVEAIITPTLLVAQHPSVVVRAPLEKTTTKCAVGLQSDHQHGGELLLATEDREVLELRGEGTPTGAPVSLCRPQPSKKQVATTTSISLRTIASVSAAAVVTPPRNVMTSPRNNKSVCEDHWTKALQRAQVIEALREERNRELSAVMSASQQQQEPEMVQLAKVVENYECTLGWVLKRTQDNEARLLGRLYLRVWQLWRLSRRNSKDDSSRFCYGSAVSLRRTVLPLQSSCRQPLAQVQCSNSKKKKKDNTVGLVWTDPCQHTWLYLLFGIRGKRTSRRIYNSS